MRLFSVITRRVALLLLTVLVSAPLHVGVAQTSSIETQLETLRAAVSELSDQVIASPDISDVRRMELLGQLVSLGSALVEVQTLADRAAGGGVGELDTDRTAADIGLTRVIARVSVAEEEIVISQVFATSSEEVSASSTIELAPVFSDTPYRELVELARTQVITHVSEAYQVTPESVDAITNLDVRNPTLDEFLARVDDPTTDAAELEDMGERLFGTFARNSLIEEVYIHPDDSDPDNRNSSHVYAVTSQGEMLRLSLIPVTNLFSGFVSQYRVLLELYIIPPESDGTFAQMPDLYSLDELELAHREEIENLSLGDMAYFINETFDTFAVVNKYNNFGGLFMNFMADNPTQYVGNAVSDRIWNDEEDGYSPPNCYSTTDQAVVREFLLEVLDAVGYQYQHELSVRFVTPRLYGTAGDTDLGCQLERTFFSFSERRVE